MNRESRMHSSILGSSIIRSAVVIHDFSFPGVRMDATSAPRIALIHDWLTGMRGGEKCLEVVCRRWPNANLYTLLRTPGRLSSDIERLAIRTSFLQHFPGVARYYRFLLPLMPFAIESFHLAHCDLVVSFSHCVAKAARSPEGI